MEIVSPFFGRRLRRTTRSALIDPTTTSGAVVGLPAAVGGWSDEA